MIANDFIYTLPDTKEKAVQLFIEFLGRGISPMYYAGGSEIITMCRAGSIAPGAVIDIKRIPELNEMGLRGDSIVIGGGVTLREITDGKLFPLLGTICGRIADHTNQCRITLGGNLCSTIIYRETAQAMLVADAEVLLYGPNGLRALPFSQAFNGRMLLNTGEFVYQTRIQKRFADSPYFHAKKTATEKIDYPLISVSALRLSDGTRIAISGYYDHPFRSEELEAAFNQRANSSQLLDCLVRPPISDYQASSEYRKFVLSQTLSKLMEAAND